MRYTAERFWLSGSFRKKQPTVLPWHQMVRKKRDPGARLEYVQPVGTAAWFDLQRSIELVELTSSTDIRTQQEKTSKMNGRL